MMIEAGILGVFVVFVDPLSIMVGDRKTKTFATLLCHHEK